MYTDDRQSDRGGLALGDGDPKLGDSNLRAPCFANGRFFLATNSVVGNSVDGLIWEKGNAGVASSGTVAYGNGVYVMGGRDGISDLIYTSPDACRGRRRARRRR